MPEWLLLKYDRFSSTCSQCQIGFYSNATGLSTYIQCQTGFNSNGIGLSACSQCQVGCYSNATGLSTCNQYQAGFYSNITGSSACSHCQPVPDWVILLYHRLVIYLQQVSLCQTGFYFNIGRQFAASAAPAAPVSSTTTASAKLLDHSQRLHGNE